MSSQSLVLVVVAYFCVLILISYLVGKKHTDNAAFYLGNRRSPWWIVAIGMVGSSISGVSFVSVPGMVRSIDFSYMQMVFGFFIGYLIIAKVLLPLYYRLNVISIYQYLLQRFGRRTYKTGASFFLLSKTIGAAARLYIVALILQTVVFDAWHIPFPLTVAGLVLLVWLYTFRSGIRSIIWTDTLQTIIMLSVLVLLVVEVSQQISMDFGDTMRSIANSESSTIFVFDDWHSRQNFFKQFFSGIFIAIVMTGLDQDMMQKNLSCKSLKDAQKNMYWYGFSFVPVNLLFLVLGAMLLLLASQNNIALPALNDEILVLFATSYLGETVLLLFILGIVAAAFSSVDSALTAITTSMAVDIIEVDSSKPAQAKRSRMMIHFGISVIFALIIIVFKAVNNKSVIDAIYLIASYTYGPLLGMFAFGLFSKHGSKDRYIPYIAIASPLVCAVLDYVSQHYWAYSFGYELLMLNGLLTYAGMWLFRQEAIEMLTNGAQISSNYTKKTN